MFSVIPLDPSQSHLPHHHLLPINQAAEDAVREQALQLAKELDALRRARESQGRAFEVLSQQVRYVDFIFTLPPFFFLHFFL